MLLKIQEMGSTVEAERKQVEIYFPCLLEKWNTEGRAGILAYRLISLFISSRFIEVLFLSDLLMFLLYTVFKI